jgi:hypothetical protein
MPAIALEPFGDLLTSRAGGQPHSAGGRAAGRTRWTRTPLLFNPERLHPEPEPAFYLQRPGEIDLWLSIADCPIDTRPARWRGLRSDAIAAGECVLVSA